MFVVRRRPLEVEPVWTGESRGQLLAAGPIKVVAPHTHDSIGWRPADNLVNVAKLRVVEAEGNWEEVDSRHFAAGVA